MSRRFSGSPRCTGTSDHRPPEDFNPARRYAAAGRFFREPVGGWTKKRVGTLPTLFAIDPGLAPVADFPVGGQHEIEGCPNIVAGETHRHLPGAAGQLPFLGRHLPALQRVTRQVKGQGGFVVRRDADCRKLRQRRPCRLRPPQVERPPLSRRGRRGFAAGSAAAARPPRRLSARRR